MNYRANEIESSRKKVIAIRKNTDNFLTIIDKRIPTFDFLKENYNFEGEILEIGAGSCWLSALLSKIPEVKKVYALDISKDLLEVVGNEIINYLGGDRNKIEFVVADFHKLPFIDNKFNVVISDASLHHARNLPLLLNEINRVLIDQGFFIAIREPIKSALHYLHLRKFGKEERKVGAIENIYSKTEWKNHFRQSGFQLHLFEEFNKDDFKTKLTKMPIVRLLNGIFFNRYYFFAEKFLN